MSAAPWRRDRGPARPRGARAPRRRPLRLRGPGGGRGARRLHRGAQGGDAPRPFYALLARQQFAQKIPWRRVHLYWGDERCVPPDSERSNYGMAHEAFIRHVPIPDGNVQRMRGEDEPERGGEGLRAAALAAAGPRRHSQADLPVLDFVVLGLGPDGHTASLFPHSPRSAVEERLVVVNEGEGTGQEADHDLPVLNAARRVVFIVPAPPRPASWPRCSRACASPMRAGPGGRPGARRAHLAARRGGGGRVERRRGLRSPADAVARLRLRPDFSGWYPDQCKPGGRGAAALPVSRSGRGAASRKVRTPQSRALDNVQAAKADGKRNRKQTASGPFGVRARVKR